MGDDDDGDEVFCSCRCLCWEDLRIPYQDPTGAAARGPVRPPPALVVVRIAVTRVIGVADLLKQLWMSVAAMTPRASSSSDWHRVLISPHSRLDSSRESSIRGTFHPCVAAEKLI